jgi:hypothetical protein
LQNKAIQIISIALFACLFSGISIQAQEAEERKWLFSGKIETDIVVPQKDTVIGAGDYKQAILSNTYVDLSLAYKNQLRGGLRFEMYEDPLPGFDAAYKGEGIPFFFLTETWRNWELTAGHFYEEFGSGMILRLYEDRSLGIDNSLRGGKLVYRSKLLNVKLLGGSQRYYWNYTQGFVSGADAEVNLGEWCRLLRNSATGLQWGLSFVSKYEREQDIFVAADEKLNVPENVGAVATRLSLQRGQVSLTGEFAVKANDPSTVNKYIYKEGTACLLSFSWWKKGMGLLLQAKRSDNMSFYSQRTTTGNMLKINHLPAFTKQYTYALTTIYPYGTQPDGEWAFQGEYTCNFKKNSLLGGRTGADLKLNYSRIHATKRIYPDDGNAPQAGTDGYTSPFFAIGKELYLEDVALEWRKNLNRTFHLSGMYMHRTYNQQVVEGHADNGAVVYAHILAGELQYKINDSKSLRTELQYLHTQQDKGDWLYGGCELSVLPSWIITLSDMYNSGLSNIHYYTSALTWTHQAHRLQLSYGRTRAGVACSGGVCRYVPANKGVQLSYGMSF